MKMLFVLITFIFCFSQCSEPKYTVVFNQNKKKHHFSQNDTLLYKGGVLSLKGGDFFIGYDKIKRQ